MDVSVVVRTKNEEKTDEAKQEVAGVKKTIQSIDKENKPREAIILWLLVASVIIGIISLIITYAALDR